MTGWATVAIDKDDNSKLHLNYWRNPSNTLPIGTKLVLSSPKETKEIVLERKQSFNVIKINTSDYKMYFNNKGKLAALESNWDKLTNNISPYPDKKIVKKIDSLENKIYKIKSKMLPLNWFDNSTLKIYVISESGDTNAVYAKKFDDNYYIKLDNREYASFWFNCIEGGALTIPFKYRPGFIENNIEVSDHFIADLNVGAYLGYSFGKIKYMYRKNEDKLPSKWLISVGPFLSVSRVEIDSTTSQTASEPLTSQKSIATISPGIGLMTSIYDFRFGIFFGTDMAIGQSAQKWDYNKRWWLGFGFGYNIGLLWGSGK